MENLAHTWHIANWSRYIALALTLELLIRAFIATLFSFKLAHNWRARIDVLKRTYLGVEPIEPSTDLQPDYWTVAILGFLELLAYPVLISTNAWTVIGAWLAFKTVPHWRRPGRNRHSLRKATYLASRST